MSTLKAEFVPAGRIQSADLRSTTTEPSEEKERTMKTKITMPLLMVGVALVFFAGCGKSEHTPPPAAGESPTPAEAATALPHKAAAEKTADAAKAEALKQQAEAEKLAAEKAAAEKLAQSAAAQETNRIQSLIDSAKNLTGQNKYAEALKILGQLANLKLTPEQQTLVDALKQTAEKQAAQAVTDKATTDASKAVGGLLGGKK